jgi:ribonuclease H2 subunit C
MEGIEVEGLELQEAYFRGRKLQGTAIPIPQGYSGL